MQEYIETVLMFLTAGLQDIEARSTWVFGGLIMIWLLFSAVLSYHWIKYNLGSAFTPIALALYGFASLALIGYAATGL